MDEEIMKHYHIRIEGNFLILTFTCDSLNLFITNSIRNTLIEELKNIEYKDVIINLRKINTINSTGIGLICFIKVKQKEKDGTTYLFGVNEKIKKSISLMNLQNFFEYLSDDQILGNI